MSSPRNETSTSTIDMFSTASHVNFQFTLGTLGRHALITTVTTTTTTGETTPQATRDGVTPRTRGTPNGGSTAWRRPGTPTTATRGRRRRTAAPPIAVATPTAAVAGPGERFTTHAVTWSSVDFRVSNPRLMVALQADPSRHGLRCG